MIILVHFLALTCITRAAIDQDFFKLRLELQYLFARSPRMIPLCVRLAFHDVFHQNTVGGRGCIQNHNFLQLAGNAGLSHPIIILKQLLTKAELNASNFQFGDVIAYSSKVAIETAYPCIHIPFKYNRQDCLEELPVQDLHASIPGSFISDLQELQDHLNYMGLDLKEFAILMAGAHGIQGAQSHAELSGFSGTFSHFSSGKNYIVQTLNNEWDLDSRGTAAAFFSGVSPLTKLIRLPLDMLLFSNYVLKEEISANFTGFSSDHSFLSGFTVLPRNSFDQAFATTFEKFLQNGGGTKDLVEEIDNLGVCLDSKMVSTT